MSKQKLLQQCSDYFRSNIGFKRVFMKIREKYKALGKIGGTIKLEGLTQEEKEALTGFLKKNYFKNSVTIRMESFQKAFEHTPFKGLELIAVLNCYFEEEIITKAIEKDIFERNKEVFFENIIMNFKDTVASKWLQEVIETKTNAYNIILKRYEKDKKTLELELLLTCKGMNSLPFLENSKERLALFASRISRNPHIFDENSECGKLLLYGLIYILNEEYPKNAEERAEVLYKAGLIKDDISNYTVCSGVLAYKLDKVHPGWEGFYNQSEPLQVSLWNLSQLQRIASTKGKIFVFENPTVFSEVLQRTRDDKISLMCTYGQVKLASLVLLDMLVKEDTIIYYSGDFDPEGIIIADKLKSRYKDNLKLWKYSIYDYKRAISNEKIDDKRMKKLEKVKDPVLKSLGEFIRNTKCAGYEELLIDELVEDVLCVSLKGIETSILTKDKTC